MNIYFALGFSNCSIYITILQGKWKLQKHLSAFPNAAQLQSQVLRTVCFQNLLAFCCTICLGLKMKLKESTVLFGSPRSGSSTWEIPKNRSPAPFSRFWFSRSIQSVYWKIQADNQSLVASSLVNEEIIHTYSNF